jgi:hypothetical protein
LNQPTRFAETRRNAASAFQPLNVRKFWTPVYLQAPSRFALSFWLNSPMPFITIRTEMPYRPGCGVDAAAAGRVISKFCTALAWNMAIDVINLDYPDYPLDQFIDDL